VIRVFLIAASPLARAALQNRLKPHDVKIVGSAAHIDTIDGQLSDTQPQVILVDASAEQPETMIGSLTDSDLAAEIPTVVLAEPGSSAVSAQALHAGIRAVLPSGLPADQLAAALHAVAAGLVVLHPAEVQAAFPVAAPASQPLAELPEPLTRREREVLQMLAAGLANKEIAARLNISDHTAKFHVASILGKLAAATRTEAVALGIRRGLVLL
jgi:two-component system, NarL family, response regulator YdfI